MRSMRMALAIALAGLFAMVLTPSARAHAERSSSQPQAGARLGDPPSELAIRFTEPPTGNFNFQVLDGCGTDVVEEASAQNLMLRAELTLGQPGRWSVTTEVISAVDGHATRDAWNFRVRGDADCPADGGEDTSPPPPQARDDGGGSAPIVPIAAGGIVLVIAAIAVRILTAR